MEFKNITTWSVSKGVATPVNPYIEFNYPNAIIGSRAFQMNRQRNDFEQFSQQHTYATDAPDASYSADCFGDTKKQWFNNRDTFDGKWQNADELESHLSFEEYSKKYSNFKTRQFLPFIDQVKAESPKFGEWISVKNRLPDEYSTIIIYGRFTRDCPNKVYEASFNPKSRKFHCAGIISKNVTHWMPLPSPPKTL